MASRSIQLRLPSVRNRILLFAVLMTLVPSIGLGWIYFRQAEQTLLESSQREMLGTVGHVRREFELWFKERYYDIRVFASSYLLSEGLEDYLATRGTGAEQDRADAGTQLAKIESYLSLVHSQFRDYARLLVFDQDARLLAQSRQGAAIALPEDWQDQLAENDVIVGAVHEAQQGTPSMLAAVPVLSADGAVLGFLAAEIKLDPLADIMTSFLSRNDLQRRSAELLVVGPGNRILLSTDNPQDAPRHGVVYPQHLPPNALGDYLNSHGMPVVGIRTPMAEFAWHIVMEKGRDQVLSEVTRLRTRTLLGVGVLAALIGFFAYLLARGIIVPLERLTEAAGKVADGDLDVRVPVQRHDELGTATQVFNDMVDQLRQSRERLEQLSTVDSLTQLTNRRRVLEKLAAHLERFRRSGTPFSLLLVDADNFKRINDDAGHLAGHKVLSEMGTIFNSQLRTVDAAGRYGGEEFLIILDDTRGAEALQAAERIRLAIEATEVAAEHTTVRFTVSIGIAEISGGDDEDQLIMRADAALYQAKDEGRNRCVLAKPPNTKVAQHPAAR